MTKSQVLRAGARAEIESVRDALLQIQQGMLAAQLNRAIVMLDDAAAADAGKPRPDVKTPAPPAPAIKAPPGRY